MTIESTETGDQAATRANRGILSKRDRKYFQNVLDVESGSAHERMIRKDIRERLENAILDFRLLLQHLGDHDLDRVLDDLPSGTDHARSAFANVIGFVYRAVNGHPELEFEEILREGIHIGADHSDRVIKQLKIELDTIPAETDELLQDLEQGSGINLSEFGYLLRSEALPKPETDAEGVSFHMDFEKDPDDMDDIRIRFERR